MINLQDQIQASDRVGGQLRVWLDLTGCIKLPWWVVCVLSGGYVFLLAHRLTSYLHDLGYQVSQ